MQTAATTLKHSLATLPHGEAFRFVDDVTQIEPGVSGTGFYTISGEEHFLGGHFPGNPIMPPVIMVEALAQLAIIVSQSDARTSSLSELRITAMKNIKVFDTATPGDKLDLRVRIAGRLGNLVQIEGQIECNNRQLVTAQITLSGTLTE
jgi:3-hydroxyacyl-[acyl-carrier-protein] dehydratase